MHPFIITIQSQVVFGHIGNTAARFALEASGAEVAAIPTAIFSNTPNYPTQRGCPIPGDLFADLLLGATERGLMERADFLMTGHISSLEVAEQIVEFTARAKAINPRLLYHCDPVMGDIGSWLYVPEEIAQVMRDRLLPLADVVMPNQFELGWLSESPIETINDVHAARAALHMQKHSTLIVTGCLLQDTPVGVIESVIIDPDKTTRVPTRQLPWSLSGTGDLYASIVAAGRGQGMSLIQAVDYAQHLTSLALQAAGERGEREVALNDPIFRKELLLSALFA